MIRSHQVLLLAAACLIGLVAVTGAASAVVEFDRATRLAMEEDYEGARREYEAFLARAPQDRLAPVAAAAVASIQLEVERDTTAALQVLDRILAEHRESEWAPEAARRKGACAAAGSNWSTAGAAYRLAVDLAVEREDGPSDAWINETTLAAADCYYQAGEPDKVIETYERVLQGSPPHEVAATALHRLGESYETADKGVQAATYYALVIERYPSSQLMAGAMGKRELIDEYLELDWRPYELYGEATALIDATDFPAALTKVNELLDSSIAPTLRQCTEYRKITLETTLAGDFTGGCERLRAYIVANPGGLRTSMAERVVEQNWTPVANLETRVRANPDDADAMSALGQSYMRMGSAEKSLELLEAARAIEPDDEQTRLLLGYALAGAGRNDEAHEAFAYYLERNPEDAGNMNAIGYTFLGRGQADDAIRYFQLYVAASPDEANPRDSLGEGYLTAGRLEEAAAEYERAVTIDPNFSNSYLMLGRVYQQLEQADQATQAYERFLVFVATGPQAAEARAALETLRTP